MRGLKFALPVLLLSLPAMAAPQLTGSLGGDMRWFDWREHVNGEQLLDEAGPLFAMAASARVQEGPVFAAVESQWGGGIVRYDGHLQSGPVYRADADEEVVDTHWRVGVQLHDAELRIGLLQRDWNRFIHGSATVSSAQERYRWRLATVGGEYRLPWEIAWHASVAAEAGVPVSSHQKVYSQALGDFGLEPGGGRYWRLSLPLQGEGTLQAWRLEPYFQQQDMGQSNSVSRIDSSSQQSFIVFQPASVRRELGLSLYWQYKAP